MSAPVKMSLFLTHMKNVNVMISVWTASQVTVWRGKNFVVAIFSDTINVINVRLHYGNSLILTELYPLIPLSLTLIVSQVHSSVKQS